MSNRTCSIVSPDETCVLGVFYENKKLYAGYISNCGANKEWSIDYDEDLPFDENLQILYDLIQEKYDSEQFMDS
jgi:hypothetical protein